MNKPEDPEVPEEPALRDERDAEDAGDAGGTAADAGSNLTVIQTVPNAARLVAHTLEEAGWDEVVGTVADDDTIFVATRTQDQDRLFQRFKQYLNA